MVCDCSVRAIEQAREASVLPLFVCCIWYQMSRGFAANRIAAISAGETYVGLWVAAAAGGEGGARGVWGRRLARYEGLAAVS